MSANQTPSTNNPEKAVLARYSGAARVKEGSLCCPVKYDRELLRVIPQEILDKDYGCGDPTKYLQEGDTVVDLGSGAGKNSFIASQIVKSSGRVIGIDMNDEMLSLARRYAPEIAEKTGYKNVEFRKGRIQDLSSLVETGSADVVISNCVLNLVRSEDKKVLFQEMFNVLHLGGRAVISDIVSHKDVPLSLQNDPELWSGCISGAFREDLFPQAFEKAGFRDVKVTERQETPWKVIEGIEFRSVTVIAGKTNIPEPTSSCCS